jgi:NMD protein affecting ribosome stability and mRNA decay
MEKKPQRSEYYEATLQLRNPSQEAINCVLNAVEKRNDVRIAKIVEHKTGIDILLSSQKFAHQIGKILKKSYKGELVESKKLYGQDRQSSRILYRRTVLFRFDQTDTPL